MICDQNCFNCPYDDCVAGKGVPKNAGLNQGEKDARSWYWRNHDQRLAYVREYNNKNDSGKVQPLTSRMGTGGGNVPMVMEPVAFRKGTRPHNKDEAQKREEADVANTLNTFEQQMLTWYNKLHTDNAEYKMWGNGIALPPALYCMQGIANALENAYAE